MEASTLTSNQQALLQRVQVRPILPTERERWNTLMRAHHYRGFRTLAGRTLRYVATLDDRWVALLGWQAAAYQCQARDRWIGWSAVLRRQRLHLIANNARFLILPGESFPNLASRILSLNLRRLSADWQSVYGHPIVLAETFVESPRFTGACYRAANWRDVGGTKGFARRPGGGYVHHGQPKRLLLYPLHPQARVWLAQPAPQSEWTNTPMQTVTLSDAQMEGLRQLFFRLPDTRSKLGKQHPLPAILTITVAAALTQAESYAAVAEWGGRLTQAQLRRIRARFNPKTQRYVAPSEPTIRRVLQGADVAALDAAISAWLSGSTDFETVAVDGKVLKGAVRADGSQVHLLSAFLHGQKTTLAQKEIAQKTNEIPELRNLLREVDIAGKVVTADALHTQRETARFLVGEKKADYLFTAVKGNQRKLHNRLTCLPWGDFPPLRRNH
ncbi:ISAs1 family transposase [Acidithiobacillus sp. M4-SHS-6]|uniref:ISAs1 family transposase n=1 Tax=Acidithiobacillus sp. M4-SHS-6 TaxID=3383024 RepID=UPI0039BDD0BA